MGKDISVSDRESFMKTDRVIEPELIRSCLKRIKDMMPILLMEMCAIFGVCSTEITRTSGLSVLQGAAEKTYITYNCLDMMKSVTLTGLILLVFNTAMIWYHLSDSPKSIGYYILYHLGNIGAYMVAIYYAGFAGLVCEYPHSVPGTLEPANVPYTSGLNPCQYYSRAVIIFSAIMIAVYVISLILTIKKERKEEE